MGDKKQLYTPKYAPTRDDVNGKMFGSGMMRECPEPHVQKKFGVGGVANVSVWTCRICKYAVKHEFHGGLSCGYGMGVPPGKTG